MGESKARPTTRCGRFRGGEFDDLRTHAVANQDHIAVHLINQRGDRVRMSR